MARSAFDARNRPASLQFQRRWPRALPTLAGLTPRTSRRRRLANALLRRSDAAFARVVYVSSRFNAPVAIQPRGFANVPWRAQAAAKRKNKNTDAPAVALAGVRASLRPGNPPSISHVRSPQAASWPRPFDLARQHSQTPSFANAPLRLHSEAVSEPHRRLAPPLRSVPTFGIGGDWRRTPASASQAPSSATLLCVPVMRCPPMLV